METIKKQIIEKIEEEREQYVYASHEIHDHPEIGNEEVFASTLLTDILASKGFLVERGVAGHDTAFIARKKSSKKPGITVGFLAEYDALPGLGHACGHNIIGVASVAAAIALGFYIDEVGGEVVVLGTPAEEGGPNGSAKGSFVREGITEGIDACMMIHPSNRTGLTGNSLAVDPLDFEFFGRPAHASASPEEGINALDGVIQLFNGINALRQHLASDVRIHGIITHGGDAPNIVPEYAKARFFIRAATRAKCDEVTKKVKAIAEGAALSTGSQVKITAFQNAVDNLLPNKRLDRVFKENIERLGVVVDLTEKKSLGSTDTGNISQVVPTIHPYIQIGEETLVGHTESFREAAKSPRGDEALILGAKALALTALDIMSDSVLLQEIKEEFNKKKTIK